MVKTTKKPRRCLLPSCATFVALFALSRPANRSALLGCCFCFVFFFVSKTRKKIRVLRCFFSFFMMIIYLFIFFRPAPPLFCFHSRPHVLVYQTETTSRGNEAFLTSCSSHTHTHTHTPFQSPSPSVFLLLTRFFSPKIEIIARTVDESCAQHPLTRKKNQYFTHIHQPQLYVIRKKKQGFQQKKKREPIDRLLLSAIRWAKIVSFSYLENGDGYSSTGPGGTTGGSGVKRRPTLELLPTLCRQVQRGPANMRTRMCNPTRGRGRKAMGMRPKNAHTHREKLGKTRYSPSGSDGGIKKT